MNKLKPLDIIALILVILGGLDWLFVFFSGADIFYLVFGAFVARIVYLLVGFSALYLAVFMRKFGRK